MPLPLAEPATATATEHIVAPSVAATCTSPAAVTTDCVMEASIALAIELITIVPAPLIVVAAPPAAAPAPAMPTSRGVDTATTAMCEAADETSESTMKAAIPLLMRL